MPDFRITPRAREDLKQIGRYTLKRWCQRQRDIYLHDLNNRFQWLAEHPNSVQHRDDVNDDYYCFPQGSHLVFYLKRQGGVDIIGIPHQRMDVLNYFDS